jgi:hypothetical protein
MIGHNISVFYILIGLFLCVGAYLLVRFFYFGFEHGEIPINKRRLFDKQRLLTKIIALTPVLGYLAYLLVQNKMELVKSVVMLLAPVLFLIIYEFLFFRPRLNSLINEAEKLFTTLELSNTDAKYNFEAKNATVLLKWDLPENRFSSLSSIKIDRVCKNAFGEYFSVNAKTDGYKPPTIKHLSIHAAKQLLSKDREVYIQEFNEEPYKSYK